MSFTCSSLFHLSVLCLITFYVLLHISFFILYLYHVSFHVVATRPCYTFHSSFSYLYYRILSYYMLLSCTFHILSSCTIHILHIHLYALILSYTLYFRIFSVLFLYWFKANTFISYLYFSYYVNFYLIFHIFRRSIRLILLLSYHTLSYVFIYYTFHIPFYFLHFLYYTCSYPFRVLHFILSIYCIHVLFMYYFHIHIFMYCSFHILFSCYTFHIIVIYCVFHLILSYCTSLYFHHVLLIYYTFL